MEVICRRIISATTKKDLGPVSPSLRVGKKYVVLAMVVGLRFGVTVYIQTEDHNDPSFMSADGFEFINQTIPSSWITAVSETYGEKVMTLLPASWNYDSFFEDVEDEVPEAMELFYKEGKQIYRETETTS